MIFDAVGRLIVMESCFVAVCCGVPESRTLNVGEDVPPVVGVLLTHA